MQKLDNRKTKNRINCKIKIIKKKKLEFPNISFFPLHSDFWILTTAKARTNVTLPVPHIRNNYQGIKNTSFSLSSFFNNINQIVLRTKSSDELILKIKLWRTDTRKTVSKYQARHILEIINGKIFLIKKLLGLIIHRSRELRRSDYTDT